MTFLLRILSKSFHLILTSNPIKAINCGSPIKASMFVHFIFKILIIITAIIALTTLTTTIHLVFDIHLLLLSNSSISSTSPLIRSSREISNNSLMAITLLKLGKVAPFSHFETDCLEICNSLAKVSCDILCALRCFCNCSPIFILIFPLDYLRFYELLDELHRT
ncbi:hypothetical protein FD29_GL001657 [Companilactobacillus mindensis DSM 14500]|uniref:Transmembrane protein n=1 Tax=Companilactobacillus mindensis DSM 14500 TaxID=1423770 RepID=A0A0R1QDH9_9LACO|nr:hypothetical protein FD29_GL001657 [Companilactobacillus mindensis DSM 14500]